MPTYHVDHVFGRGVDGCWPHVIDNLVWLDHARHEIKSAMGACGNGPLPGDLVSKVPSEEDEVHNGDWKDAIVPLSLTSLVKIHGSKKVLDALDMHEAGTTGTPGWDEAF